MEIFTQDKGPCPRFSFFQEEFTPPAAIHFFAVRIITQRRRAGIHGAVNICVPVEPCAFILHGTTGVALFQPVIGCHEIGPVSGFVPQRPDNDGGVILIPLKHPYGTIHMSFHPDRRIGKRFFAVTHAMAFNIGFIHHIKPVFVAKVIPGGNVRIVRSANCINIKLLHQQNIFNHAFPGHHLSPIRIGFVTVNPFNQNPLSIDQQVTVFNLHTTEAHFGGQHLNNGAVCVFQTQKQCIEIGGFRRPFQWVGNPGGKAYFLAVPSGRCPDVFCKSAHLLLVGIKKPGANGQRNTLCRMIFHFRLHDQLSIFIRIIQQGAHFKIPNMDLRRRPQIDIPENTAHTPEILIFKIGPVAPAEIFYGNNVFARFKK